MISTLPHTVTITHPGTATDRYRNVTADWENVTTTDDVPGWVQQRTSTVSTADGRGAVITLWQLFVNPDVPIADRDRVTWEDRTFEVDGDPVQAGTPAGVHHIVAALKTVEG